MSKIFLGIIVILLAITGFLYLQNQKLNSLNQAFSLRDQEQKATIENLQAKNQEIEAEMNRYLDIFKRHNLSKLAAAKPGLIQNRVNDATKEVFNSIEQDSRNIDSLDDGLQLQSDT